MVLVCVRERSRAREQVRVLVVIFIYLAPAGHRRPGHQTPGIPAVKINKKKKRGGQEDEALELKLLLHYSTTSTRYSYELVHCYSCYSSQYVRVHSTCVPYTYVHTY